MVYEANARIRDPVYGCAGAIFQLQKQIGELQAQLAQAQAELVAAQSQQANFLSMICMDMTQSQECSFDQQSLPYGVTSYFPEDNNLGSAWEPYEVNLFGHEQKMNN